MKKRMISILMITIFSTLASVTSFAGNDPSIKGNLRAGIKESMNNYIRENTVDHKYYMFDAVTGKMLHLTLKKLHSGIVKKEEFYVSCADFTDTDGRLVDLDFLVMADGGTLKTLQSVVHAIDGKKRNYHLE